MTVYECVNQIWGTRCRSALDPKGPVMDVDVNLQRRPLMKFTLGDDLVVMKCEADPMDVAKPTCDDRKQSCDDTPLVCDVTPATSCTSDWSLCQLRPGESVDVRSDLLDNESFGDCGAGTTTITITSQGEESPLISYNTRDCCSDKRQKFLDSKLANACGKGPSTACHDVADTYIWDRGGCLKTSKYKDAVCQSSPKGDLWRLCCRADKRYCPGAPSDQSIGSKVMDSLASLEPTTVPQVGELGLAALGLNTLAGMGVRKVRALRSARTSEIDREPDRPAGGVESQLEASLGEPRPASELLQERNIARETDAERSARTEGRGKTSAVNER